MARILIVDDQPDTLLEMRVLLDAAGHETLLAADAERAAERLAGGAVDLVIVDVTMTVGDGWNVLRSARAALAAPRVLAVSNRATPGQIRRAEELGAGGHLGKAELSARLVEVVGEALANW